jgi:putative ABC transport system permease protein
MFKNYFTIAVRNLLRRKSYAFISTFSLVVGITCFIFLMLYVKYEVTYDSFHEKSNRIYKVTQHFTKGDFMGYKDVDEMSGALAPTLKREFPEVEYAVRIKSAGKTGVAITYKENGFMSKGLFADVDFFNVFTFPLITGNKNKVLEVPYTIALTENLASKLFGNEDPIGKVVKLAYWGEFTVSSIIKNIPENTNLNFEFLLSFKTLYSVNKNVEAGWGNINYQSYILLKDKVSHKEFENKLTYIVDKYHPASLKEVKYNLLPVEKIHLASNVFSQSTQSIDTNYIYLLISIAFIVLMIGCINYMNLATACAGTRGKEVGIRKTVGADRMQLLKQFLSESFILTFISIAMSVIVVAVTFPYFKEIANNGIKPDILINRATIAGLIALFILVGFLSGSYPAFILSSLKPVNVLKRSFQTKFSKSNLKFRNILVVLQFCITIILVIAAVVVQKQLYFIKNSDIGYNRNNIVAVKLEDDDSRQNYQLIKTELLKNPNVLSTATSDCPPITLRQTGETKIERETGDMVVIPEMSCYYVDYDFINLFNIKMLNGRGFSQEFSGDIDKQVIINETAAKMIGLKDPVGKKLERDGKEMKIIGVTKDFHFTSLKTKIEPLMFTYSPENIYTFFVKISDNNTGETLSAINAIFKKFSKSFVYDYSFMDDLYNNLYKKENNMGNIVLSFSIITIIIASIGLFGLISFIAGRKTKEIGVRKILGASVFQVVWLIIREFFVLLVMALIISLPVAYYFTNEWLRDFVYRIDLNIWLFLLAIGIIAIIAFLSIAQQAIKAAVANPIDSLRSE